MPLKALVRGPEESERPTRQSERQLGLDEVAAITRKQP
jgi:hypothetical protein